MAKFDEVAKELRRIYREKGNRLHPPDVLEEARNPDSPLHSHFTWDDGEAAAEYRLIQARKLIANVQISIPATKGSGTVNIRAYHAIRSERNGYRHTRDIMAGPELRASLMAQLVNDLERVQERYDVLRGVASAKHLFTVIAEFCGAQRDTESVELAKPNKSAKPEPQAVAARRKTK